MTDTIPVDYVIFKLNEIFNVKDISSVLVTAENVGEAREIHSNRDFDRVPIKKAGSIDSFYDSNSDSEIQIKPEYILSESAGIYETLSYLSKRDFYFVLIGNGITHMVHYSDLNSPLVSIGIYTQIAYCEEAIRDFARLKNNNKTENGIENFLKDINNNITGKEIRINSAKKHYEQKKQTQTETDLFDELYFDDELILFRELYHATLKDCQLEKFKKIINLEDTTINSDKDLRNEIMHSKPEIIKQKDDTKKWLSFLQRCQNIINTINGKVDIKC